MHASHSPQGRQRLMCRPVIIGLALAAALWGTASSVASAHAHLTQADPAPQSVIAHAPAVAWFIFDEPLNPTLTRVRITNATGRQVAAGGRLAPGHAGEQWQLPLPSLPSGIYSVFWTSESATDGHVMSSFYTFRVMPSGSTDGAGAVIGTAAGVYGGSAANGPGAMLDISGGAGITALFTWLELLAQAVWLGALIIELGVLRPARCETGTSEARLAWAAAPRLWWLVRGAPMVAVWSLGGEVISLALQGTGGNWSRALAPVTLGGILSSQNGRYLLLRGAVLLVAVLLSGRVRVPSSGRATVLVRRAPWQTPQSLGIMAPMFVPPRWESMRWVLTLLALGYMGLVASSGHAANVSPAWLSYSIDWIHLVCTAAWAGGIAALACGVLPVRRLLPPDERAAAVLPLLDRFSPVAYSAVGMLALSGFYNGLSHLTSPAMVATTLYGQLLVLKVGLVGFLMFLSASHVYLLRPSIQRADARGKHDVDAMARVHEGLATLAGRIRLEAGVGAAILLATALMGQTLPYVGRSASTPSASIPPITGTAARGDLRGRLMVSPPLVGPVILRLQLWQAGEPVTGETGAAIIHLYPAAQPALRATLTPVAQGRDFLARGSLPATGTWQADVLVRTERVNDYRMLSFTFTVGSTATFLAPGISVGIITIAVTPGRLTAANTCLITGLHAPGVRLLARSLDMNMGLQSLPATPQGGGRWRVHGVVVPMAGRWGLSVQAQNGRTWATVRQFTYDVPRSGPMHLLPTLAQ